MAINFTKMHGLGNDFMLFDEVRGQPLPTAAQWRALSDRHRGVGFDQAVVFGPARSGNAVASYRIFNADGGEAEQSGNGARCAMTLLHLRGLSRNGELAIDTGAGLISGRVLANGEVSVSMGEPDFDPRALPFIAPVMANRAAATYTLDIAGEAVEFGAVSMGNPHAVIRVTSVEAAPVERLGKALQAHPHFPRQVNVGFLQIVDASHVRLRVYERGAGETQACGTGSCAAVAFGRSVGLLTDQVEVQLPGGKLGVNWPGAGHTLWLTGPAEIAYTGRVELSSRRGTDK
jgi:diaminopimelate epimerase